MKNQTNVRLIIFLSAVCIVCTIGLLLYKNIQDGRADARNEMTEALKESEPYGYRYSFIPCTKEPDREDVLCTYQVDYYTVSDGDPETKNVIRTETVSERICDH